MYGIYQVGRLQVKGDITPSKHHLKIVPDTKTLQDILISVSHCFIIYIGSIDVCYIGIQPSDVLHMQCIVVLCQRSEEHTSELQSRGHLVCRLLLEKKNKNNITAGVQIARQGQRASAPHTATACE